MLTMFLQVAVTAGFLVFGLASLGVGEKIWHTRRESACAWWLTGAAFTLHALSKGSQNLFGILALRRGAASSTMEDYLVWNPIFNHSRTFHLLAFLGVLAFLLWRPGPFERSFLKWGTLIMAGGILAGGVLGWAEGEFTELFHYAAVARWDIVELLLLLGVLFGGMTTGKFDRLLWFALCVYAFSLALNVLWFAALSRIQMPGEWAPRPWAVHLYRLILTVAFAAIALQRLKLARRGRPVRPLIEQPPSRISTLG